MSAAIGLTFWVRWSREDGQYVGTVSEFPSLSWLASEPQAALQGIRQVVADVVAEELVDAEIAEGGVTRFARVEDFMASLAVD